MRTLSVFTLFLAGAGTATVPSQWESWASQHHTSIPFSAVTDIARYWLAHPDVQQRCGAPVASEQPQPGYVSQRFQRCTISAFVQIAVTSGAAAGTSTRAVSSVSAHVAGHTGHVAASAGCSVAGVSCQTALLRLLNRERAAHHVPPLQLDTTASTGAGTCPGARGHSVHMAQEGTISHDQFPYDVCGNTTVVGENVGVWSGVSPWAGVQAINQAMLAEPWKRGCSGNHHCNIDDPAFHRVGIGIAVARGAVWVTEDFLG